VYSHHDVRKATPEQWRCSEPFEPVVLGNRLHGRGSSDAKGQVLAHLWGVRGLLAADRSAGTSAGLPVTLKLLVEGEEEAGSPNLADLLHEHRDRVAADLVLLSDTMTWAADRPAVCTGNRGMMKGRLEIRGAERDAHGGAVGGAVTNAAAELVRVLALLHDDAGLVTVPGFYDDVAEVPDAERAAIRRLTQDADDWRTRTGAFGVRGERGRSLGELLYTRPAVEVLLVAAGDPELPSTGTVPATARAQVQVSLVPHQDPDKLTERFVAWFAEHIDDAFDHDFSIAATLNQPAYVTPREHPVLDVLAGAMSDAWGTEVGWMRNAGGAPTALLADTTGAPVAFFGTGLPEDNWHGPDESADLDVLLKGAATMALFWPRLAAALARHER
jgi:acetylornithine deacetylase/succinyl-diaminopimelate desuccinylase-like protein